LSSPLVDFWGRIFSVAILAKVFKSPLFYPRGKIRDKKRGYLLKVLLAAPVVKI